MSLQQLAEGQDSPEVPINENSETLEHVAVYGQRQPAHSGLTWGYYGGRWGGFSVADGTLSLTASSTNYVVVAIATGVISVATTSTNWDNDTDYVRVYKITTGTSGPSAIEDHRAGPGGVHGSGGGSSGGGIGVTDGDKGDIIVSSSGTVWNIDNDAITYAKMQNVSAASKLIGRGDSGSGDPQEITLGSGLTMTGTTLSASGGGGGSGTKTYATLTALNSFPPLTNYATLDTLANGLPVLDFDGGSLNEAARWILVMPEAASLGSGLKFTVRFTMTSATSGSVRWGVSVMRLNADISVDSFDTSAEAHTAVSADVDDPASVTITLTTIDAVAAQEAYVVEVYRDASDTTNDTATGDAELHTVEVWSAA
jgi:hypothetical protein